MGSTLNFSLLDKVIKLCKKEKKKQNQDRGNLSITWLLFSQGSSMIIAIGFFMTFSENVFDNIISKKKGMSDGEKKMTA